jgi:hypothetical protein
VRSRFLPDAGEGAENAARGIFPWGNLAIFNQTLRLLFHPFLAFYMLFVFPTIIAMYHSRIWNFMD